MAWQDDWVKRRLSDSDAPKRHRTAKEKAEIFRAYGPSGLSLLAFARKQGLCYASLLRWRSLAGSRAKVPESPESESDPRFVPVTIESEVLGGDYVLSWTGGRSLKIPLQFETDSLRRLLMVLEGLR